MSLVVGVTKLAWMFEKSRDWAERLLEQWHEEQLSGSGPVRVFKKGRRGSLFTTLAVLHQYMPPGRDLVLYRRMKDVEETTADTTRRLDREIVERKRETGELRQRVGVLESRRRAS